MSTFLFGTVEHPNNNIPAGLRILATRVDDPSQRWSATVDSNGTFELTAEAGKPFVDVAKRQDSELIVRVLDGPNVVTRVVRTVGAREIAPTVVVPWPADYQGGTGVWVGGQVRSDRGDAAQGLSVEVFEINIGSRRSRSRTQTDANGCWALHVSTNGTPIDLQLNVLGPGGAVLATESTTRRKTEWAIDVVVHPRSVPASRFERLRGQTSAEAGGTPLRDLAIEDRALVARRIGAKAEEIETLAADERWVARGAPEGAVFALASDGGPYDPRSVLALSPEDIEQRLTSASDMGDVAGWQQPLQQLVARVREAAADLEVDSPSSQVRVAWLGEAGLTNSLARAVTRAQLLDPYSPVDFDALAQEHNAAQIASARFVHELAGLGLHHARLVRYIDTERQSGSVADARSLGVWSIDDWRARMTAPLDGSPVGAPDGFTEREYAEAAYRSVEARFPSTVVAHHWTRVVGRSQVADLIDAHPDFDLGRTRIDAAVEDGTLAVGTDETAQQTLTDLRLVQRLFALGPIGRRSEIIEAVHAAGYRSASQVVDDGPEVFARRVQSQIAPELARTVYARAQRKTAVTSAFVLRHHPTLESKIIAGGATTPTADLETLFGPMGYCGCTHCRSVLSPAAYLADLLALLRRLPADDETLLDRLQRDKFRGDLVHLELSCANTHTALPYIDLVIERLEASLRDGPPPHHQTTESSQALRVYPQHLDQDVYDELRDEAVHPFGLPFDLATEEIRAYLGTMGVSWAALVDALARPAGAPSAEHSAEGLGVSAAQLAVLVEEHAASPEAMWGVDSLGDLESLPTLLDRSGLDIDGVRQLLATVWFRTPAVAMESVPTLAIEFAQPCDIDSGTIAGVPSPSVRVWSRAHRLLRLARQSGWSLRDTDLAVRTIGGGALDRDTIVAMAHVERLRDRVGAMSTAELLAWWGTLDTQPGYDGSPSLYTKTFVDAVVGGATSSDLSLNEDATELQNPGIAVDSVLPELAALLRTNTTELVALLAAMGDAPAVVDLASLSLLFRYCSAARALSMRPVAVAGWIDVLGIDPFTSPRDALAWIEQLTTARTSGLSLEHARHVLGYGDPAQPNTERQAWWARMVLAATAADAAVPTESSVLDELRAYLAVLVPAPHATDVEVSLTAEAEAADFVDVAELWLGEWVDVEALATEWPNTMSITRQLATQLAVPARHARRRRAVIKELAVEVGMSVESTDFLLDQLTTDDGATLYSRLRIEEFLGIEVVPREVAADGLDPVLADDIADALGALAQWHRVGQLLASLSLDATLVRVIATRGPGFAWVPSLAPLTEDAAASARESLHWITSLVGASRNTSTGTETLVAVLDAASEVPASHALSPEFAEQLAAAFGWDAACTRQLAGHWGLTHADLLTLAPIRSLARACSMLARSGLDPARAIAWSVAGATKTTAEEVRRTATARVDPARRPAELGPVRDAIREQQRDALLARYYTRSPGERTAARVHGDLLVDPEMSSCRMASRVQQAIAAVQLYIQRIALGLEGDLSLPPWASRQWEWMRNYRVWEANRKVFLWPENWLDPQLRPDRTELFDEAITALSGTQLDDDTAQAAVVGYLHGLRERANLIVSGLCYEADDERLHVFARSRSMESQWYYRRHQAGVWTPWESVSVSISNKEVLPLVVNGQVVLVWHSTQPEQPGSGSASDDPPFNSIYLHWSFYDGGRWSSVHQSDEHQTRNESDSESVIRDSRASRPEVLALDAVEEGGALRIVPLWRAGSGHYSLKDYEADPSLLGFTTPPGTEYAIKFEEFSEGGANSVPRPLFTNSRWQSFHRNSGRNVANGVYVPLRRAGLDVKFTVSPRIVRIPGPYSMIGTRQKTRVDEDSWRPGFASHEPFAIRDSERSFIVWPQRTLPEAAAPEENAPENLRFRFEHFGHPFVPQLLEQVAKTDVHGMYRPSAEGSGSALRRQLLTYGLAYHAHPLLVDSPFPRLQFDFSDGGAYSENNWELFVHLPLAIAARLSTAGRHTEAKRWLEHIFDPMGRDPESGATDHASHYWMVKPLWEAGQQASIEHDLRLLTATDLTDEETEQRARLRLQIERWKARPFEPHVLARLRPGAYQRQVVIRYLDALFAWADSLFARGTTEAIDEASQLYFLAAEILGPRPAPLPERTVRAHTFAELEQGQDEFANFLVTVENLIPAGDDDDDYGTLPGGLAPTQPGGAAGLALGGLGATVLPTHDIPSDATGPGDFGVVFPPMIHGRLVLHDDIDGVQVPYFCVPPNETLLEYWDTLEDRLFKIRQCLDLHGSRRVPDLFAPPIDPALLVDAVARGIDLRDAVSDLFAPVPHYRFGVALRRAKELASFVRELGRTLLSAIERRDGEFFAALQGEHERVVLDAVTEVRDAQIEEIDAQLAALDTVEAIAQARRAHFDGLLEGGNLEQEQTQLESLEYAGEKEWTSSRRRRAAALVSAAPVATVTAYYPAFSGTYWQSSLSYGSSNVSAALNANAETKSSLARRSERTANKASINAMHLRRTQQWTFERDNAALELERIAADRATTKIRREVANLERKAHQRRTEHAQQRLEFLRTKYTQAELHDWMAETVAQTHRHAYTLALELARKAERAYQYELADPAAHFVGHGHWDEHRRGLLAGERLGLELERMETAYLDNDRRERELVKHVSLSQVDPGALLELRYAGACDFDVPEELFALDHPSHYLRRIRSVALTVPSVSGPLSGVHATVTLLRSEVRPSPTGWDTDLAVDFTAGTESIAVSSGLGDRGTFDDGTADGRRRPFEGRGAISRWQVELPAMPQFDYRTIGDLTLEIRYTARDAGRGYAQDQVLETLPSRLAARPLTVGTGWAQLWNVPTVFASAWTQRRSSEENVLTIEIDDNNFPHALTDARRLRVLHLVVEGAGSTLTVEATDRSDASQSVAEAPLSSSSTLPGTFFATIAVDTSPQTTLRITGLDDEVTNLDLIVEYSFASLLA